MPQPAWPKQSLTFGLFFFAYYGYVGVFSPFASLFFAQRGMTATEIGVLMSLMQVMRIFGPNLWGWIADHLHARVTVLRVTASAAMVLFIGMFFAANFWTFFWVMVLVNLFTGAQGPLSEALMLTEMRGDLTHYGKLRLWGSVGFIVAVTGTGELLDRFGVGLMPTIAFALLALLVMVSLRLRESAQAHSTQAINSMRSILCQREVIAFFTSTCLMVAAHAAVYVFYSLYLQQQGYSKTLIGVMWSIGVVAEIGFFYFQAPIFRRFGVRRLMIASLLLAVVRFSMIGLCAQSLVGLVIAQLLHAASFAVHHSSSVAMMQRWFAGRLQARGQALYTSISYGIGGSAGGLLLSVIWDKFGAQSVFFAASALCGLAVVAAALSLRWQIFYTRQT